LVVVDLTALPVANPVALSLCGGADGVVSRVSRLGHDCGAGAGWGLGKGYRRGALHGGLPLLAQALACTSPLFLLTLLRRHCCSAVQSAILSLGGCVRVRLCSCARVSGGQTQRQRIGCVARLLR
jgi:hypothetical protein